MRTYPLYFTAPSGEIRDVVYKRIDEGKITEDQQVEFLCDITSQAMLTAFNIGLILGREEERGNS